MAKEHDQNLGSKPEASDNDRIENEPNDDDGNVNDVGPEKEGKKRMRQVGKVEIPQEAFLAILQVDN